MLRCRSLCVVEAQQVYQRSDTLGTVVGIWRRRIRRKRLSDEERGHLQEDIL